MEMQQQAVIAVAVIGGGLMGHAIAQVFAQAGHRTTVTDADAETLRRVPERIAGNLVAMGQAPDAVLAHVTLAATVEAAVASADLVIEAAPERLELKQRLFAEIAAAAPAGAILASNTSVIPIGRIGEKLPAAARARLVGTHWWNPPHLVPLVEVVRAQDSDEAVIERVFDLLLAVGKKPVRVQRDIAGFVGNRLQHALWREALALVADGVCDAATIDTVVKNSFGLRLPVLGPMENIDLVGLDLTRDIHRVIFPELDCAREPSPLLDRLIAAGKQGMKTGEGLQSWSEERSAAVRRRLTEHLLCAARTASA